MYAIYIQTQIHAHTNTHIQAHTNTYIHTHILYTQTYMYIHTYTHTMHTCMHTYAHIHTHISMHTHNAHAHLVFLTSDPALASIFSCNGKCHTWSWTSPGYWTSSNAFSTGFNDTPGSKSSAGGTGSTLAVSSIPLNL